MDSAGGLESPETVRAPVALDFPAGEASPSSSLDVKIPRRIRRRFLESAGRGTVPSSAEEIEAKLREADLRRQQFHEWLSSKARPKQRSLSWSSQEEDLGQRLEARLSTAERKRLGLLAKAQMRLAKLDELRQAAKKDIEKRFEKEREELGTRVEYRAQQAEANRMRLLKAHMQRRAAAQERKARSLSQRVIREIKYKERVRSAISQKRAAAEKKRVRLLEEEKKRAHARVVQAYKVAKIVCNQRESERSRLKEQLENRLQRAKRQRAEYLKQRGSPHSSGRITLIKHGDGLSRKLARCWRSFVRVQRTTFSLAQRYEALRLNENSVKLIPFEQLAFLIESTTTLEATKALLDRLEIRFSLLLSSGSSSAENIDHLLKHLATPKRRVPPGRVTRSKGGSGIGGVTRESRISISTKLSRYPVRIVLCAYMILGQPNAVFSGHGEREAALRNSAVNFVREFETLIRIIMDGTKSGHASRQSSPDVMPHDSFADLSSKKSFRSQLSNFDAAWRSYIYRFVAWKVKDAKSLEEDLVRAACQLELSMMQTCKLTSSGQSRDLSHDMRAIQKQVIEDQKLLREKVLHLSGDAGIERMECALSDTRSKYFGAMEAGDLPTAVVHISSPSTTRSLDKPLASDPHSPSPSMSSSSISTSKGQIAESNRRSNHVVRSLFGRESPLSSNSVQTVESISAESMGEKLPSENELLVNEIIHRGHDTSITVDSEESMSKVNVKEIMEKAFWDTVMESMKEGTPDLGQMMGLVREIQDELIELAPQSWRQEIIESINLDILSQVFCSGTEDIDYLGKTLQYMLSVVQKLSAVATEEEMIMVHQKLLEELRDMVHSDDKLKGSFHYATIKGLRFVLEQIQKLKKEVSKAHMQLMEPIIKGSAGLEYLKKAFADRYGEPSAASRSLPLTLQWISSLTNDSLEEWNEYADARSILSVSNGLPPATALKTGGALPLLVKRGYSSSVPVELPECKGEEIDKVVRLGLLRLASMIEGVTSTTVPETLKLNILRLRSVQSQLQHIIVIATSALILRQILLGENTAASPSVLEGVVSATVKALSELLASAPDVGMEEIIDTMVNSSSSYDASSSSDTMVRSRKETMTRLLVKCLQNDDPVFTKVSRAVYLAARGVVLGGTGTPGQRLADAALCRVGASLLLERVVKAAETLLTMALVTTHVHGPWYQYLV